MPIIFYRRLGLCHPDSAWRRPLLLNCLLYMIPAEPRRDIGGSSATADHRGNHSGPAWAGSPGLPNQ